jgi:hypothetical protein
MNALRVARLVPHAVSRVTNASTETSTKGLHAVAAFAGVRMGQALVLGTLSAMVALPVMADEPGDIIVQRQVTPRIAYRSVPVEDDPVTERVTTFPSSTFDPLLENVASDLDLSGARGSAGVAGSSTPSALSAAMSSLGVGAQSQGRNGAPMGAGAAGGVTSIGATVSQTITGALAPLTTGMGALK